MYRSATVALLLFAVSAAAAPPKPAEIAKHLVQSAGVGPGDVVRVGGNPKDIALLTAVAVEVEKAGGTSFFDLTSEESVRRICAEVPPERDADNAAAAMKLLNVETVDISVSPAITPGVCSSTAPARLVARGNAFQPVNEAFNRAGIRAINLGNGMEPSEWRAKRFAMTAPQLSALYWAGIGVDPAKLKGAADPVTRALGAGKQLTISAANGTKVSMSIEGRKVLFSDGRVTPEMAKKGQTITAWLPAGDVYLTPVPGTAEGTVIVDRQWFQDLPIDGLTLTMKGGKVVEMTGKGPGFEKLKAAYDAAKGAKDAVAVVNIGVNPALRGPPGSKVNATPAWGVVSFFTGDNVWAGGSDVSSWGLIGFVPAATVTVDGATIVHKGQLVTPGA
jgi:leucyl aminopeptidase (aminopeptidase T)